ncbi:MAG: rRNA methyltransferase [Planctomycetaceae bacterium]|nr:rRNA methyltransferase [Planctomycetaceae bacterium]HCK41787.1 rRNA methyltransferase [Planctomycetaceae bacterium]
MTGCPEISSVRHEFAGNHTAIPIILSGFIMPTEKITSRQNARVKDAAKLRSRRQREKQSRFLIDGAREIHRAMAAKIQFLEVYICPRYCTSQSALSALEQLPDTGIFRANVTPEVWEKLCFGERNEGLVVVAQTPERHLGNLSLPEKPLVAVLEGIEKPGNVGAILRTADGAGIDGIILADPQTDLFNPNTIRASLGTVFAPHICTATLEETLAQLRLWQLPIFAAQPAAEALFYEMDLRQGAVLVLGSESDGLTKAWQGNQITGVQLPMQGIADSLNVSATAAVMFYEAIRQRGVKGATEHGCQWQAGAGR